MLQAAHGLDFAQNVQPVGEAFARDMLEVIGERVARRHLELGKRIVNFFQPDVASFRDLQRPRQH